MYPEVAPAGQPKKNGKPPDDAKSTSTDWQKTAADTFPQWNYEAYPNQDPMVHAPGKAKTSENSASQWAGVPFK